LYSPNTAASKNADVQKTLSNMSNYLSSGELYNFEKEKASIDTSKLSSDEKKTFDSLNSSFLKIAENYFYNNGLTLYKDKNYKKSLEYFQAAYKYKNGSYLDQHIVFFTGLLTKMNNQDAKKYFLEYVNTYKDGCYMDEVLYNLAVMYSKEGNPEGAKKYALLVQKNYSKSDFYNDTIKNIINK
jgi:TolA-binding protein